MTEFVTLPQIAREMGIPTESFRTWFQRGIIPDQAGAGGKWRRLDQESANKLRRFARLYKAGFRIQVAAAKVYGAGARR